MRDIKKFHDLFYANKTKCAQDSFIISFCSGTPPKRNRPRENAKQVKRHTVSVTYKIATSEGIKIPVCREAFLGVLNIKKDRVLRIIKKFRENGQLPVETRGGDRIKDKNVQKKQNIKQFIESLKCTESHYCRSDAPHRVYLPCELNVKKLWVMYNMQANENLKVRQCFFRNYFNRHYNVGFGTPQTDVCSQCLKFKEQIKRCEDPTLKQELITNHRVHKLQAKSFYDMLQRDSNEIAVFSFDCEKNMPLPKLPDQQAYFSMQLNFYNLGVVAGNSRVKLSDKNVSCFVWTEADRPKSSNEIASVMYYTLQNFEFTDQINTIRLFCDGCGGQNKNSTFMGMLSYWMKCLAPPHIKQCEVIFPVVGHSFIPPDRVFGNIEKDVRKKTEVLKPEDYVSIIKSRAKVLRMGQDFKVFDWKTATKNVFKSTTNWHFKFKPTKRFIFTRGKDNILIRGESFYRNDLGQAKGICKRGMKIERMKLKELQVGLPIKPDKVKSIESLLKNHYGDKYKECTSLEYFIQLFENNTRLVADGLEEEQQEEEGDEDIII